MRRGHTLVEVLLAAALFGTLLVALAWVYAQTVRAARQSEPQSEAARTAVLGLEKIRSELRGALVLGQPQQAPTLTYRSPTGSGPGGIEWSGERTLALNNGALERTEAGQPVQRLAFLGAAASVRFHRPAGALDLLEVRVEAEQRGRRHTVSAGLPLYQQH